MKPCQSCQARNRTSTPVAAPASCSATDSPAHLRSLRPWAEYLAEAGLTVSLPRLPGHGTTWQEMARTRWEDWYAEVDRGFEELRGQASEIFVMGLSMGGCLALRMAEIRGPAVQRAGRWSTPRWPRTPSCSCWPRC